MNKATTRGNRLRKTALTAALLAAYGYMPISAAVNLTVETHYDLGSSSMSNSTITVNNGGVLTGNGAKISGGAYDVILVNSGGSLTLSNARLSNNLDHPTGTNGRTVTAKGANAMASLTDSTIIISAQSTNPGTDYAHAFTAGVGAVDGGHVDIHGGSITASGSKRTVGIQANDGGSISASNVQITTNGTFGHAVQVYRTPTASETATHIDLDHVSILTNSSTYSVGIQSANKGASVAATDTDIATKGTASFGVEVFNGATAALTNGSITTQGDGAAGVRVYSGSLGQGSATVNGTHIQTSGLGASGILAGDLAEPTSGMVTLINAGITTTGDNAAGLESAFGSSIASTNSGLHTRGASSHGVYVHDGGSATLINSTVDTQGANAAAASVNTGGTLTATNSTLVSLKGDGIVLTDNAAVTLTGTRVEAAHASLASNLNSAGQKQDITIGSGSTLTDNDGTLLQVNRTDAGMDGIVNLTLKAGSNSRGDVIDLDGLSAGNDTRSQGGTTNFTVDQGASWIGIVRGIHDATTADGGSFVDNGGAPIAGNVTGGENSTIVFNNGATVAGGLSTGTGSRGTFNGATSIGGNLMGAGSTLDFNGPASIGQNVDVEGSQVTFGGSANISQSVMGGSGSTVAFGGPATIAGNVTGGSGSSFSFTGPTNIGQSVTGSGTSFRFSTDAPTTIGGNVELGQGASLQGGTTTTPITISGNTVVNSGSVLGGNLIVQGALSGDGGTLSPGNSVGSQSYATSADFNGAYTAEINGAGQSDLIIVRSGDFDLAGVDLTVAQENGNGGYLLNHAYTIVQTENGNVVNRFASEKLDANSFANAKVKLDPVKYGQQDVKVSLSADAARIDDSAWSANQKAAYNGIVSAGSGNPLAFAVLASSDMGNALKQISGELHGSTQSALINAGDLTVRTLSNRMRGNVGAGMMAGALTAQASGSVTGAMPQSAAYPLWAQVVGNWGTLRDDGNSAKVKTQTGGLFVGGDTAVGGGWRVGGALGFTNGQVEVNDRASKSDVTSYTAALYGGNSWATSLGSINLLGGAAYTRHNIDSRRTVNVGGTQTLKADYQANTTQLFTELGYTLPVGQSSTVEPYLGVAWLSQRAKSFSETGGSAALRGESQHDGVTTMTLGLRGSTKLDMGSKQALLRAGLGWRHAAGDVETSRRMAFIQGNGTQFKVAGAPIAKNAAVLDLGAEMSIGKTTALGLSYTGQFGGGNTDSVGSLYLKIRFN